MQVKQEQISPCEIELEIEVEAEKVAEAFDQTYKELSKVANIPGFRKGKAPRQILEQYLDRDKVRERALEKLADAAYADALKETGIDPYAPADTELVKFELGEPLVFKAKVPLRPKVELGSYVGLEIERKVAEVPEERVDQEIRTMLERHAKHDPITDRGAQEGDAVVVEVKDENDPESKPRANMAIIGENLPGFDEGVKGMRADEEKVIEITYPDDHADEELRGKTIPMRVKIIEVNQRTIPELTDEWVKSVFVSEPAEGEEAKEPDPDALDTVEKLKSAIRSSMEKAAQDAADADVEYNIVKTIADGSQVDFPEVMVNAEVSERIEGLLEQLKQRKIAFEDYLKHTNQTFEQLRDGYAEDARQQLRTSLVLREIVDKEKIKVDDEDEKKGIRSMSEDRGVPVETVEAYLDRTDGRRSLRNRILHKKIIDFLVAASNIKSVVK